MFYRFCISFDVSPPNVSVLLSLFLAEQPEMRKKKGKCSFSWRAVKRAFTIARRGNKVNPQMDQHSSEPQPGPSGAVPRDVKGPVAQKSNPQMVSGPSQPRAVTNPTKPEPATSQVSPVPDPSHLGQTPGTYLTDPKPANGKSTFMLTLS